MSFRFEINPREAASTILISRTARELRNALGLRKASDGLTQAEVAEKLETDKATLTKCLSGFRNMTLKTLSDIVWAIGAEIEIKVKLPHVKAGAEIVDFAAFNGMKANTFISSDAAEGLTPQQGSAVVQTAVLKHAG
ncbi:helix-turn-helix domain-containing protein [Rhizobium brockwellii]|uniref:helix-turn-helix domain-containing protein n=1 Tax=Rhizobium brockwellii TaxID=3019932 RepID=UPI003F99631F